MRTELTTNRRHLMQASAAVLMTGALPPAASAQEATDAGPTTYPQPSVDARFAAEVAPGIFVIPDQRIPLVPNVGIVVGTERVLVVDCGLGIDSAEAVIETARRLAAGREIVLTLTHAHPEHGFGAQIFAPDARIFYNRAQADYLARAGQGLLNGFRSGVLPAEHQFLLDGIEVAKPDET